MKKKLVMGLVVAFALSMVACGSDSTGDSGSATDTASSQETTEEATEETSDTVEEEEILLETLTGQALAYGRDYQVTVDVPSGHGYKFYDLMDEEQNEEPLESEFDMANYYEYALCGDELEIYFQYSGYYYNTSSTFAEDHPDMDADNPNFADFVTVLYPDEEVFDLNGRSAIRTEILDSSGDTVESLGYYYFLDGRDDFNGYLDVAVMVKGAPTDIDAALESVDAKTILGSLTITRL